MTKDELKAKITELKEKKKKAIANRKYDEAVIHHDEERKYIRALEELGSSKNDTLR